MDQAHKDRILEKVAYSIRRGQGYGSLKRRGFDPAQARAAVQAYYAQRGRKSGMLYAGDTFSRGADGGLVFQRGKNRFTSRSDRANKLYAVTSGQGANESILDRGALYPMSAKRLAQPSRSSLASSAQPPRPPIVQTTAVVRAPTSRLPQQTGKQLRAFKGPAKRVSAARLGAVAGRLMVRAERSGTMEGAGKGGVDVGFPQVKPGPANIGTTNIAGGPAGFVTPPPAKRAPTRRLPAMGSMVAGSGI
jgi:hypothetical protein